MMFPIDSSGAHKTLFLLWLGLSVVYCGLIVIVSVWCSNA